MGCVSIRGLYKDYEERRRHSRDRSRGADPRPGDVTRVLDDINLEIEDGELVCILGPSGCGKSTMLRIVAGFEEASGGQVVVDDRDVAGPSQEHIFVFQHSGLFPWLTVGENAHLGVRRLPDREAAARKVQEALDLVELSGFENHYPRELSGGMQRRAELARALVVNPDLLFMDEPFAGLDHLTRLKLREEIVNMHSLFQKTILFITHDIDEALVMGDRIVLLSDRPARVVLSEKVDSPHPRDFSRDERLASLRKRLYRQLEVHFAL
jgi:ABC-type nitrate/sulfonate/bicarbonate transport system ATPase subunit